MKKVLGFAALTLLIVSCNKGKDCYECKTVWSDNVENMQNSIISQAGGVKSEEFCGTEEEVAAHEAEYSYTGVGVVKSTNCISQN